MRRLAWGRWVLGIVLWAVAGVGCDGDPPGGHKPDGGSPDGAAGGAPGGPLPDGGGPGGAAGSPAAGEPPAIGLAPGSICDPTGWCWYNPRPSGYLMLSVAGTSNADIWIAGSPVVRASVRRNAMVDRAHGDAVHDITTLVVFANRYLGGWRLRGRALRRDLVRAGPRGGQAAPTSGPLRRATSTSSSGLAAKHFDGVAWTDLPMGGRHVAGSGPDDVWIADNETLWHFDGVSFSPQPPFEDGFIADIAVAARNDVWVATFVSASFSHVIRHFDGTTWSVVNELPTEFRVQSITATAPNDVWVTGGDLSSGSFVIHWDGQSFESEVGLARIFSVERVGSDYFAVGDDGKVFRRTTADSPWREISDGPTVRLNGTWGSAPDDMWAVGDEGTILHHDGREVSPFLSGRHPLDVPHRRPFGAVRRLGDGAGQRLGGRRRGHHPAVERSQLDDVPPRLSRRRESPGGVHRKSERRVDRGRAQLVVPRARRRSSPVARSPACHPGCTVRDIHGTAAGDIWAVAAGCQRRQERSLTLVSHFDGNAWSSVQPLAVQADEPNWRLWAVSSDDVWLRLGRVFIDVGQPRPREGIEYWHFDGQVWSQQLVQLPIPSDIWMFGDDGYLHFESPPNATFSFGQSDVWAAGDQGRWLRRRRH